jgi:pimeloyl-ACP methyl ester carboxylesterase
MIEENDIKENDRLNEADKYRAILIQDLPVSDKLVTLAGIPTAVLEGGEGPAIILLHGPGESAVWWMRVIPDLVKRYRVIAPDLPGHGASGLPEGKLEREGVLKWVDALIKGFTTQPPVLVGHVLGGAIAARYAIKEPDTVSHLILVDSLGLSSFRPSPMFAFELFRFMIRPNEKSYLRFLPHCMYDVNALSRQMGEYWQPFLSYNLACAQRPEGKAATRKLMGNFGMSKIPKEELRAISLPVTLIWGRHDRANSLKVAANASKTFGWPLHIIENCRDDPKLEQPTAFVNAVFPSISEPIEEQ